jgi:hypothetical protein
MDIDIEAERKMFDEWYANQWPLCVRAIVENRASDDIKEHYNMALEVWQARAALAAPQQELVVPVFTEHDLGIIRDIEVMASDKTNGFWSQALANAALRLIHRKSPPPAAPVLSDERILEIMKAALKYEPANQFYTYIDEPSWSGLEQDLLNAGRALIAKVAKL